MREADRVNNLTSMGIFMVMLINVFLVTFGGAPRMPSEVAVSGDSSSESAGGMSAETDGGGGAEEQTTYI